MFFTGMEAGGVITGNNSTPLSLSLLSRAACGCELLDDPDDPMDVSETRTLSRSSEQHTVCHDTQDAIVTWPSKGRLRGILKVPLLRQRMVVKAWVASLWSDFPCRALRYTCVIHVAQCILAGKQTLPSHPTRQWSADNLISGIH